MPETTAEATPLPADPHGAAQVERQATAPVELQAAALATAPVELQAAALAPAPVELQAAALAPAAPPDLDVAWKTVLAQHADYIARTGYAKQTKAQRIHGAQVFVTWVRANRWTPESLPADALNRFQTHCAETGSSRITTRYLSYGAKSVLDVLAGATSDGNAEDASTSERAGGAEVESTAVDEAPPQRARRNSAETHVHVHVPSAPPPRTREPVRRAPPRPPDQFDQATPAAIAVNVYRRVGGHRAYIDRYTVDDLGSAPLVQFLKENVDPEHCDASGTTTYEVVRASPTGGDEGQPWTFNIRSPAQAPPAPSDIDTIRQVMTLLQEIQAKTGNSNTQTHAAIEALQARIQSGQSSTADILTLYMMEKLSTAGGSAPNNVDAAIKIVEMIQSHAGAQRRDESVMAAPIALPPVEPSPLSNVAATVLQKLADHAVAPQPEPPRAPTLADQLKDLAAVKDVLGIGRLEAALERLAEKLAQPAASTGPEQWFKSFEMMTTFIKNTAPTMNLGGIGGVLERIITPKLGAALGDGIAAGVEKLKLRAASSAPAAALPAQTDAGPPASPPAGALPHFQALKDATEDGPAQDAMVAVIRTYVEDPNWAPHIATYLADAKAGKLDTIHGLVKALIGAVRPDLASRDELVNGAITRIANGLGAQALAAPSAPQA